MQAPAGVDGFGIARSFDPSGRILSPGDFGRTISFDSSPKIIPLSLNFSLALVTVRLIRLAWLTASPARPLGSRSARLTSNVEAL